MEKLKGNLAPPPISDAQESVPLLVTTGPGENINNRCGLPHTDTFENDRKYLFLHNLCEESSATGEGITSFYVLKSWFTAFFKPPRWTRPVLDAGGSNPQPSVGHRQHVDDKDANMEDTRSGTPNQREQDQEQQSIIRVEGLQGMDMDEPMQGTIESEQQKISEEQAT